MPMLSTVSVPVSVAPGDLRSALEQAAGSAIPHLKVRDTARTRLVVHAGEAELRTLFSRLADIVHRALGGARCESQAMVLEEGGHAVLYWAGTDDGEAGARLSRIFNRPASGQGRDAPAEASLMSGVNEALRIVRACGGRLYAAPSPLSGMGLTLRLPLASAALRETGR